MKGKSLLIILGLAVLVVLIVVLVGGVPTAPEPADTTAAIQEELEGIDLGELESEFEEIDADLNTL